MRERASRGYPLCLACSRLIHRSWVLARQYWHGVVPLSVSIHPLKHWTWLQLHCLRVQCASYSFVICFPLWFVAPFELCPSGSPDAPGVVGSSPLHPRAFRPRIFSAVPGPFWHGASALRREFEPRVSRPPSLSGRRSCTIGRGRAHRGRDYGTPLLICPWLRGACLWSRLCPGY